MAFDRFQPGVPTFTCSACGRLTRHTSVQSVGSTLCPQDFDLAGLYNELQDEGPEAIHAQAAEVRRLCASIVAAGGKLDADARELLSIAEDA